MVTLLSDLRKNKTSDLAQYLVERLNRLEALLSHYSDEDLSAAVAVARVLRDRAYDAELSAQDEGGEYDLQG